MGVGESHGGRERNKRDELFISRKKYRSMLGVPSQRKGEPLTLSPESPELPVCTEVLEIHHRE